jgi:hypothetical protein
MISVKLTTTPPRNKLIRSSQNNQIRFPLLLVHRKVVVVPEISYNMGTNEELYSVVPTLLHRISIAENIVILIKE